MENKKTDKVSLRQWSGAIFQFSLMCSVGLALIAFEWKSNPNYELKEINQEDTTWLMEDVPVTYQNPPPPPVQVIFSPTPDEKIVVPKDYKLDIDLPSNEGIPEVTISDQPPVIDKPDEIEDFTDIQASFKGGMDAWYTYLLKNMKYPTQARRMGIEGLVIVRFVVNLDGSIQDAEVIRSLDSACDKEALSVVQNSPNWNPGKIKGRPVRSRMVIPIRFRLN